MGIWCTNGTYIFFIVLIFLYVYFLHQMTPLHVAASQGHLEIVKCIVDKGADIITQDVNGVNQRHYTTASKLSYC